MRIMAEQVLHKRPKGAEHSADLPDDVKDYRLRHNFAFKIAKEIADKIEIESKGNGFTETHSIELFVLSKKQAERIGELIDYDPYQDNQFEAERRLNEISSILLRDNLE